MYELLFGKTPFTSDKLMDLKRNIVRECPDFSGINISEEASDLISKLLEKNKKDRLGG